MKKLIVFLALSWGAQGAYAQELESLFNQGQTAPTTRNSSYLADTLRGILRTTTPEQNFFLRYVEESNWIEALLQFKPAFGGTSFAESEDGRALKALLMFQTGLVVNGLESLFQINEPKKIHFQILNLWREAAPASHPAWQVAKLPWKKDWSEILGVATEVRVKAAELAFSNDIKILNDLSMLAASDSTERALLDWNLALQYGQKDDTKKAAMIISSLLKSKNNPIPEELLNLTAARLLFQSGYFEAAEKYYDKIVKGSDYYPQAQEEKAWTFLRRRQPQNALAITQSLVNPVFSGQVGPETWFVRALAQLKVCDYPEALQTLQKFPKEFKDRTVALDGLSKNADQPEVNKALDLIKKNQLTLVSMVGISKNLPRGMVKDQKLKQFVKTHELLTQESAVAEKIFAQSLKGAGLQGEYDKIKNQLGMRTHQARSQAISRVQELAGMEVRETKEILNKLHIVEAEIIQQVESAHKLTKNATKEVEVQKGTTGAQAQDVLKFPFTNEFWFDEITNYRVDIKKGCQARRE